MLQDLTKQVSLGEENSLSVRLSLWGGPWGQDPWGQGHSITVAHVRKTQMGGDFCHKWGGSQEHGGVGASLLLRDVLPSPPAHTVGWAQGSLGGGFLHHPGRRAEEMPAGPGLGILPGGRGFH